MPARYRDLETGHFVSKDTWEGSHGRGGDYVREYYTPAPRESAKEDEDEEEEEEFFEEFEGESDFDFDLEEGEY